MKIARLRRQSTEPGAVIDEPPGEHVYHLAFALHFADHAQQTGAQQHLSLSLKQMRPDDNVDTAALVLQGDKHHTGRGSRPLARDHQPGHTDSVAMYCIA